MKQSTQRSRLAAHPRRGPAETPQRPEGLHQPSLGEIARSVAEGRWVVLATVTAALAAACAYLYVARPVYRSRALVHVVERPEEDARLEDILARLEPRATTESEIELMRSRQIAGTVVDQLHLDVEARPRWFPVLGPALARRHEGPPAAPPLEARALAPFAWGGERIAVSHLAVPEELLDKKLLVTALPDGRYSLADGERALVAEARVGQPAHPEPGVEGLALTIQELVARPGTQFVIEKLRREEVITALHERLYVEEQGKKTGVVALELEGDEPVQAARVLTTLVENYVRENVERSTAQAARVLAFLETQLPELKRNLERAEAALNSFRRNAGTVDLPIESKVTVERVAELDKVVADLEGARALLRQRYGDRHPDVVGVERQLATARAEREGITSRVQTFPTTQLGSARLTRDVTVATDLYLMLLGRAQELRVLKSGRTGSVRIVDRPFAAHRPDRPKVPSVLALSILLGLIGGVAITLARRALDQKVEDPQEIERATGLSIFLAVPHSERERQRSGVGAPLAVAYPDDTATETLRALRSSLVFLLKDRPRVVVVSSPSPGVGKTFVCANLAHLFASAGQRVLLVDADLRRGTLHRSFGIDPRVGLSEVVSGSTPLSGAIRSTDTAGLDLLPCGTSPSSPAELLTSPKLKGVLAEAAALYDVVVVDTPPVLAVADAIAVASHGSVNLLVLRARQHAMDEIALAIERFRRAGIRIRGGILNDVRATSGVYARVYEHRSAAAHAG